MHLCVEPTTNQIRVSLSLKQHAGSPGNARATAAPRLGCIYVGKQQTPRQEIVLTA